MSSSLRLETISTDHTKSFSFLFNPRLSDLYFWHFHPAYELVYISGADGRRQIADHRSNYLGSDLVLIGSGIPHLNFDYGVASDYKKVVLHLKKELVESHFMLVPELSDLQLLFSRSSQALVFEDPVKSIVGERLFELQDMAPGEQYLHIISILQNLGRTDHVRPLLDKPYVTSISNRDIDRINIVHGYIDDHYQEKISLDMVASLTNLSKEAFCRYFKQTTDYTFVQFLQRYRISQAKLLLIDGKSISEACYACGFESPAYFNRVFNKITGVNPSSFKKQYIDAQTR